MGNEAFLQNARVRSRNRTMMTVSFVSTVTTVMQMRNLPKTNYLDQGRRNPRKLHHQVNLRNPRHLHRPVCLPLRQTRQWSTKFRRKERKAPITKTRLTQNPPNESNKLRRQQIQKRRN